MLIREMNLVKSKQIEFYESQLNWIKFNFNGIDVDLNEKHDKIQKQMKLTSFRYVLWLISWPPIPCVEWVYSVHMGGT